MDETTSTTETVTKKSAGNVKITLEEYHDLQARANEPKMVTYNRIEKTPEMAAADKVLYGDLLAIAGGVQLVIGIYMRLKGKAELKAL